MKVTKLYILIVQLIEEMVEVNRKQTNTQTTLGGC